MMETAYGVVAGCGSAGAGVGAGCGAGAAPGAAGFSAEGTGAGAAVFSALAQAAARRMRPTALNAIIRNLGFVQSPMFSTPLLRSHDEISGSSMSLCRGMMV